VADRTAISWANATWNFLIGCDRVSPGCDHCYAITTGNIRQHNPNAKVAAAFAGTVERRGGRVDWTGRVNVLRERLALPLRWRKPRRVFVNSLSDLFHADVPDQVIVEAFAVMAATPQHTYQVLTKRHGRMLSLLNDDGFVSAVAQEIIGNHVVDGTPAVGGEWWPLPNLHLGVSVEDQKTAVLRIPALRWTPAAVRWVSCEPLLADVDLVAATHAPVTRSHQHWPGCDCGQVHGLDWVVVGGESGPGARAMDLTWARHLVGQCQAASVPVFVKQLGSRWGRLHHDIELFPPELRVREYPTATVAA
jgi:protein gp37